MENEHYIALIQDLIRSKEYRQALDLPKELIEEYKFLARGEYNVNLVFTHPKSLKKLVFRINTASQMNLDNQIEYEAKALKLLEPSKRTPKLYYVDDSKRYLDKGILVMEYLEGRALKYFLQDLQKAAQILADIHSLKIKKDVSADEIELIEPADNKSFIIDECIQMFSKYKNSNIADKAKCAKIENFIDRIKKETSKREFSKDEYKCLINTELNSSNFIINEDENKFYLIDWEKPILAYPAQDLGHFLAPTTTFWKTDIILNEEEIEYFIDEYIKAVGNGFDLTNIRDLSYFYIKLNCLRGITWCSMAYVEYKQATKDIMNESTRVKLEAYMSDDFLALLDKFI